MCGSQSHAALMATLSDQDDEEQNKPETTPIKTYCKRKGLGGTRAIKESQDIIFNVTEAENIGGRTGRINLLSGENRVINTTAETPESLDLSGKSKAATVPKVTVIFAEQPDVQAVRDVLGMLMRERKERNEVIE